MASKCPDKSYWFLGGLIIIILIAMTLILTLLPARKEEPKTLEELYVELDDLLVEIENVTLELQIALDSEIDGDNLSELIEALEQLLEEKEMIMNTLDSIANGGGRMSVKALSNLRSQIEILTKQEAIPSNEMCSSPSLDYLSVMRGLDQSMNVLIADPQDNLAPDCLKLYATNATLFILEVLSEDKTIENNVLNRAKGLLEEINSVKINKLHRSVQSSVTSNNQMQISLKRRQISLKARRDVVMAQIHMRELENKEEYMEEQIIEETRSIKEQFLLLRNEKKEHIE